MVSTTLVFIACVESSGEGTFLHVTVFPNLGQYFILKDMNWTQRVSGFPCIASFTGIAMQCKIIENGNHLTKSISEASFT